MIWTKGQRELVNNIVHWYKYDMDEDYVYSGAAGTGKTTVLRLVLNELGLEEDEVIMVAYTGKAASVLMQKGFNASTIHSAFFEVVEKTLRVDGKVVIKNGREVKVHDFRPKEFIDPKVKLIILDEWSMANTELAKVMYKFGIPIIASGDKYQLRPIFGESPFASKVKFNLTEITRQAEGSGIIQLADLIRKNKELPKYHNFNNDAWVMNKDLLEDKYLLNADIILTAKNKTRNIFNNKMRELHNSHGKLPNVGDKMVCRKNNWNMTLSGIPLVNGIIGKVVNPIRRDECNFAENIYRIDFQPDYVDVPWEYYEALPCDYEFLTTPCGKKEINKFNYGAKMEFAEAITVHLSQGSQFGNVVYYDEVIGDRQLMNQLRYTAITRATDKVHMFI